MKRYYSLIILLLSSLAVMAVPARRGQWVAITLADGTTVRAETRGDEHARYWQSENGERFVRDDTSGFFRHWDDGDAQRLLAKRRSTTRARRQSPATRAGSTTTMYKGQKKGLIILVQFADKQFSQSDPVALYRTVLHKGDKGGTTSSKFDGKSEQAVSNIPVYRKSEMPLVIAECEARQGNLAEAKNYLFYTARRNLALKSDNLPGTQSELLSFIADERVREFYQEGKRFFDARRLGLTVSGDNFSDWDISKFAFPIPSSEVNSGFGVAQNEGWSDYLPKR